MTKDLPDKWIRKAIADLVEGIDVNGETISCHDSRVTARLGVEPDFYVLISTQTNEQNKINKCEDIWDSEVLLDIRAHYDGTGNSASRVQVDDMTDAVRDLIKNIQLDGASGLTIVNRTFTFPNDLTEDLDGEIVYRKFIRVLLQIQ